MFYFNPWEMASKRPFGAIANENTMTLTFKSENAIAVKLIIHRDFGAQHEFEMTKIADDLFETEVTFNHGRALYFYHFEVTAQADWGMRRFFYGAKDGGGEGVTVDNESDVVNFQVTVYDADDSTPDWYQNAIFYQIFPDRFFNGNDDLHINASKPNSFLYATEQDEPFYVKDETGDIARWDFYGGNLQGIIKKLDYLQELGVTALYLNPIFLARSNHRYDTSDYLQIDPMLGTEDDFRQLVEAVHARGMHIILDGVFSHVGQDSRYFNISGTFGDDEGAARNQDSPYFEWFKFEHWPFDYKSWWGIKDLPEIDKNNQSFRDFIYGAAGSVLSKWHQFDIDGWRLDVADELPDDFIRGIRSNLSADSADNVLIGEVWEDASNKFSYDHRRDYILGDGLQGVMNYPLRDVIIEYLDGLIDAETFARRQMALFENYPRAVFYGNLNNIGTHDTERILTMVGDDNMEMAVGLMFTMPGVPCIYYGDEAGLTGRKDPTNRKFMPWEDFHDPFYQLYTRWTHERLRNSALKQGDFSIGYAENCLAILRNFNGESYLYLVNPEEHTKHIQLDAIHFLDDQPHTGNLPLTELELPEKSDWFGRI